MACLYKDNPVSRRSAVLMAKFTLAQCSYIKKCVHKKNANQELIKGRTYTTLHYVFIM